MVMSPRGRGPIDTHRIDKDGVFMPHDDTAEPKVLQLHGDGARLRYVSPDKAVKEWRHPDGEWRPWPAAERDDEVAYGDDDVRGGQVLSTWAMIGCVVVVAAAVAWLIWGRVSP